ncbi:TBC1 domain family member 2A-like isoform X1 [Osmerus eperlanus]|uniref:TBC1 domain family member 2A-like isoform X1 n=1 Tax=Osmerus eperlanus TaxID=29151 RepID=UPI002E14C9FD
MALPKKDGDTSQMDPSKQSSEPPTATLCGYLHKLSGPLKVWRSLWFTYEEEQCILVYYRTAQDANPLGCIDLSNAILGDLPHAEDGTFFIQTPERTFTLKAVNSEAMIYWLKQLQLKRWHFGNTGSVKQGTGKTSGHHALRRYATLSDVPLRHPPIGSHQGNFRRSRSSQELSQVLNWEELCDPVLSLKDLQASPLHKSLPKMYGSPSEPLPIQAVHAVQGVEVPTTQSSSPINKGATQSAFEKTTIPQQEVAADTSRLQQEVLSLAGEVKAQKELVTLLQKALKVAKHEKQLDTTEAAGDAETTQQWAPDEYHAVHPYDRQGVPMPHYSAETQEHLRLLVERNWAERETVVRLSQEVAACLADPNGRGPLHGWSVTETNEQLRQENRKLKDDIEAYKIQNTYLNSEVYQLTKVWRQSAEQEKSLTIKCAHLETKVFRMESRFLVVLLKLQEGRSLERHREAITTLVTDALRENGRDVLELSPSRITPEIQVEDLKLLAKLQALGVRTHNSPSQPQQAEEEEGCEEPLMGRWAQHFDGRRSGGLVASPKLKGLLRKGVPRGYRRRVWRWVVWTRTRSLRERHPQRYHQLCLRSRAAMHPASRQIRLDLEVTLRGNRHFSSPAKPALQQLHRILMAFSWHNPTVGYCQGLNRLAAVALLVLQNEEDAFWCLVAVVETIMPQDFYSKTQTACQVDLHVLKDFLAEKMPKLMAHFQGHGVDISLVTSDWFLAAFVERLAGDVLLRVWDSFLYEGTKVIFRYALALFKYKEDDILKICDCDDIYQYLRFFPKTIIDGRKLMMIAFSDMNPFPIKVLRQRRAQHLQRVQTELSEQDRSQKELQTERVQYKDKELGLVVSEDEGDA